jgi:hypothetical protein
MNARNPKRATPAGRALVDKLIGRLRALRYFGPIVTAGGELHPDAETFLKSHRATTRRTAGVAPLSEADFLRQLRAYSRTIDSDPSPELPQAEPEPERRAYPPADERTVALRRRAIFEAAVEREGLTLAPDLGAAWQEAERLAAD